MNAGSPAGAPLRNASERAQGRLAICALLLLIAGAYEGVRHLGFLRYDDDVFITHNPWVRQGLTWASVRWALRADLDYDSPHADYWSPLTILTRLVEVELFGMRAGAHHLTNLALHAANVMLAYLLLHRLTRARWPSFFVAAVLAVHPLHVESVAWVSERKDVLSLFFLLAAIGAHAAWVARPTRGRQALVALAFAGGLLAKPSVVTLPVLLLLLDRWPLRRVDGWRVLVAEKWPLFLLSAASVAVTVVHLYNRGLLEPPPLPLAQRVANAMDAYVGYLADAVWPAGLAIGRPRGGSPLAAGRFALGAALVLLVTAAAVRHWKERPYLLVGWGWFAIALSPAITVLQSGWGRADRYMYIPLAGVSLAVAWLVASWARGVRGRVAAAAALAASVLVALALVTRRQVGYWRDDRALFQRAVAVEERSVIGHNGLAAALLAAGDPEGAERHLRRALQLEPDFAPGLKNLTAVLMRRGRTDEAARLVEDALRTWAGPGTPARSEALFNLALVRTRQGRPAEALELYAQVAALDPRHWAAHYNAGNLLAAAGRLQQAGASYARSLLWNRENVDALRNLGLVLVIEGRSAEAITCFRTALEIDPSNGSLHTGLGRALASAGRHGEALDALREGVRRAPASGEAHFQLAEALRAQGAAAEAQEHYREAVRLDPSDGGAAEALGR